MPVRIDWRRSLLLTLALANLFALVYVISQPQLKPQARVRVVGPSNPLHTSALDVASSVYVANLPRRMDRHRNMSVLAKRLDAHFTFVGAIDMRSTGVQNIMNHVKLFR